jgi:tRNA threonylcarbamoyladenosine biosynthesis protein TsaB
MSMGITLSLDGSTYAGSVACIRDATVVASHQLADEPGGARTRGELFMPMVAQCMNDAGIGPKDLARIVCGAGPGSFTSLRVAASIAKGMAVGAGCPLFAVSSLMLMVPEAASGRFLAVMPAMRGEVFAGLFDAGTDGLTELSAPQILHEDAVTAEAEKLAASIVRQRPHAARISGLLPSILESGACDIDSWEPTYGRLAEAQVRWEAAHGRPLSTAG